MDCSFMVWEEREEGLVSSPAHTRLPVRNGLVNTVEYLGFSLPKQYEPMRLQDYYVILPLQQ